MTEGVGQHQLRLDALTLVADDRDVAAVVQVRLAQQVGDAALLDGDHAAEAVVRPVRLGPPIRHDRDRCRRARSRWSSRRGSRRLRRSPARPEPGVRLDQLAARLVQDAPVAREFGMLLHEQRQEHVAEPAALLVLELLLAGQLQDLGPGFVEHLLMMIGYWPLLLAAA